MTDKITYTGEQLVKDFNETRRFVQTAQERLDNATAEAEKTEAALAKWLLPEDAKVGEKICVWSLSSLYQAHRVNEFRTEVTVRLRGNRG